MVIEMRVIGFDIAKNVFQGQTPIVEPRMEPHLMHVVS
jgi:hypothetical protein